MTKATIETDSDEPVLVLVIPLRKAAPRPAPVDSRRVFTTTAEPVAVADNIVPLRKAVA